MAKSKRTLYLEKANENIYILNKLKDTGDIRTLDCQITIVFYICIHYLNCYYCYHTKTPPNLHVTRKADILYKPSNTMPVKFSKKVYYSYLQLSDLSENSRYNAIPIGPASERVDQQKTDLEEAEKYLAAVKEFIETRGCSLS